MKTHRAFTIVELLIVVVVIAILAAVTVVAYNGIKRQAETASTSATIASYVKALKMYASEHDGKYPLLGNAGGCLADPDVVPVCGTGTYEGEGCVEMGVPPGHVVTVGNTTLLKDALSEYVALPVSSSGREYKTVQSVGEGCSLILAMNAPHYTAGDEIWIAETGYVFADLAPGCYSGGVYCSSVTSYAIEYPISSQEECVDVAGARSYVGSLAGSLTCALAEGDVTYIQD